MALQKNSASRFDGISQKITGCYGQFYNATAGICAEAGLLRKYRQWLE